MDKIGQIAIQLYFGWLVMTCGATETDMIVLEQTKMTRYDVACVAEWALLDAPGGIGPVSLTLFEIRDTTDADYY